MTKLREFHEKLWVTFEQHWHGMPLSLSPLSLRVYEREEEDAEAGGALCQTGKSVSNGKSSGLVLLLLLEWEPGPDMCIDEVLVSAIRGGDGDGAQGTVRSGERAGGRQDRDAQERLNRLTELRSQLVAVVSCTEREVGNIRKVCLELRDGHHRRLVGAEDGLREAGGASWTGGRGRVEEMSNGTGSGDESVLSSGVEEGNEIIVARLEKSRRGFVRDVLPETEARVLLEERQTRD
jgi:hypothetical protein